MERKFSEFSEFREPDKSLKHEMVCLAGTVVGSWSLTQEVFGWQVETLLLL